MKPSTDKVLLHSAAAGAFVVSTIILALFSKRVVINPSLYINIINIAVVLYNAAILISFLTFDLPGGAVSLVLATSVVSFLDLKLGYSTPFLYIGSFIATGGIGYAFLKKLKDEERRHNLRIEKLEEGINLLNNGIEIRQADIKSLRGKIERYSALKEVAEALGTTIALDEIAALVVDSAIKVVGKADRALLFLTDAGEDGLALHTSRSGANALKAYDKKGDAFDKWVFRQKKPLLIEDTDRDFRFSQADISEAKKYFRSLISVPLIIEGDATGVLRLDCLKESSYNQDDLRLLDVIADLASVALENNRLYKKTEELAIKDGLTDLVVHRYFKERLFEETKRAMRSKAQFSLLMLDIDYFKKYNDRYGHIVGDIVLRYLAGILKDSTREGDIVARYGGEEFALLLLGKDKRSAINEAEAIRRRIESEPLVLRREKANLTVSIGVANFPSDAFIAEDLLKKADDRLYKAKKEGRNRVSG